MRRPNERTKNQANSDVAKKSIIWLHLSDLHMCNVRDGYDSRAVTRELLADLVRLREKHQLHIDLLFFTGDLAFGQLGTGPGQSLKDQLEETHVLINQIRKLCTPELPLDSVFLIPGNHDIKRDEVLPSETDWLDKASEDLVQGVIEKADKQWVRITERLTVYKQFLEDNNYHHLLSDKKRLVYAVKKTVRDFQLGIAGFNTAWSCSRDNEKGKLWLGRWQLQHLTESLHDCSIRFALMHHPLDWLTDREDPPDLSVAVERDFTFLLNGHEHKAWVQAINERHIHIAAGAAYNRRLVKNYYRVGYNVTRYFPATGLVEIFLRTWNHDGAGWVPQSIKDITDAEGRWRIGQFFPQRARLLPKIQPEGVTNNPIPLSRESEFRHDTRKMVGLRGHKSRQLDAFVAIPMAALINDPDAYQTQRREGGRVVSALERNCKLKKIYYPARKIQSVEDFDPPPIAIKRGLSSIRFSRLFIMIYSAQQPSSVLVEAGYALALRIPSLYFVKKPLKLPFLLNAADKAFKDVVLYEYDTVEDILEYIKNFGAEVISDLQKQTGPPQQRW